jgi:resuscitation-promoting factor RpfB
MRKILDYLRNRGLLLLASMLVVGGILVFGLSFRKTVTLWVDGQPQQVTVLGLTVADALRAARITPGPGDRLAPPLNAALSGSPVIWLERAAQVQIDAGGQVYTLQSAERRPANLLLLEGLRLYPGDEIRKDGLTLPPGIILPAVPRFTLQLNRAVRVTLVEDGHQRTFYSLAATLGEALAQAGVSLAADDILTPSPQTPLDNSLEAVLRRAVALEISVKGKNLTTRSTAQTVGQALAAVGMPLQGLDYSQPAETEPLPADGRIRVVQVRETLVMSQKEVPFETHSQADPNTELDQRSVIQAGQTGLVVSRVRLRYEDGKEVSRQSEGEWQARQPKPRLLGYGTKIVIRKLDTPDGTIEYWRAVTMYATSYSPCNNGTGACMDKTATGATVAKGVVALSYSLFNVLRGQRVYVPGYGDAAIADYGGISGRSIDLGYSDSDYVGWHKTVTVYFLTPVPANIPWTLP